MNLFCNLWKVEKYFSNFTRNFAIRGCNLYFYNPKQSVQNQILYRKFLTSAPTKTKISNNNTYIAKNPGIVTKEQNVKNKTSLYYLSAFTILVGGCTYLSVLLYRLYCQTTGKGGQAVLEEAGEKIASMQAIKNRRITVNFNADINSSMMWNFKPQQPYITVSPGETALAFYTALNPTNKAITGVATYNVLPFEAGKYFNKIQCFCFEEQQLNPHEEVDMPVFFYLDPEFAEDPYLEKIHDIVLSYTFFEAKEGMQLPRPSFVK